MLTAPPRLACALMLAVAACASAESHLMRLADIHNEQIVFTYEDDLWLASTDGGLARRLTSDPGIEMWAKFSPDGRQIAFTAQYDGGLDVYVMDTQGGIPKRLTWHPGADRVLGWWPDGQFVYFRSVREYPFRGERVYKVPAAGGATEPLPVDRAGLLAVSPDGQHVAYNRISREAATWKRHVGGDSQNIWMGSLAQLDYKVITPDWIGTSNFPMWEGDAIYFTSDRQHSTLNLYKYDPKSGKTTALTSYKDYDVKYPSSGPGAIIYQYAETLYVLDLKSGASKKVDVEIPTDAARMRPELVSVAPSAGSFSLSPSGKRALIEARGEILNVPAKDGEPINLTRTSGTREKNAAWSPDGRWVAFLSDKSGEEEIYLVDQKGEKEWKQLTSGNVGFRMHLIWSPDSKSLLFSDKFMRLNLADADSGQITVLDQADYDDAWERWGIQDYVWSPCGRWIAYTKMGVEMHDSIYLYSLDEKKSHRITDGRTEDWSPSFDPDGKYLWFLSNRTVEPHMGFDEMNYACFDMAKPYFFILAADAASPYAPKDSEEEVKEEEKKKPDAVPATAEAEKKDEKKPSEAAEPAEKRGEPAKPLDKKGEELKPAQPPAPAEKQDTRPAKDEPIDAKKDKAEDKKGDDKKDEKKTKIDLDGLARRVLVAEGVSAGNYFRCEAIKGGCLYLSKSEPEFTKYQVVTDHTGGGLTLHKYTLEDKSTAKLMSGIANYHQSADGKKLIYRAGGSYGVVDAGKPGNVGDGKLALDKIRLELDRPQEFRQIFNEAWRIQRDWFYDPNMHSVDWAAMREQYGRFVPFCGNRGDLNYLIGEMLGELNIGHTYISGGEWASKAKNVSTGLLGVEFAIDGEHYRIARIIPGTPGDPSERSPLDEPGCPIKAGMYLLAIDGHKLTTADDPCRFLQNKANAVVTLTYNAKPTRDGAKEHRVRTIASEFGIRYREWVEKKRKYVEEQTNGEVGYLHIPDMGENGVREFAKAWHWQYYKKGIVLDERYNGGGHTADMIIDRLERKAWCVTAPREGKPQIGPERCFWGPWCVLVNEDTGSNGEFFAEAIKVKKLAPIIGMRTWGGAIGIEPHQDLVDGGSCTPPQFGLYSLDRKWLIEGVGVVPDMEVQNMPGDVLRGKDAQLDFAIEYVLKEIKANPKELPAAPPYPDKSKKVPPEKASPLKP